MSQQLALPSHGHPETAQTGEQTHTDQELTILISDLRRIGYRLQSPRTLNHPHVKEALGQLDNELAAVLGQGRGRHRVHNANRNPATDPFTPTTSAQFVAALRQYRASTGSTPFRQMAIQARHVVPHSAMCVALNSTQLPPLNVVLAIVIGCGGSNSDLERFTTAWHCLAEADHKRREQAG